eukprot:TRINITY_DN2816_c0_g2_i4.p1 TRINITY_DN2816_c0_g2~~TRINITY_DN2816_c0_g2_i4.p1  ORF type:complete len:294 (+),score=51.57 TRINITY_DN2816_c0_g2_i4:65-946(+)
MCIRDRYQRRVHGDHKKMYPESLEIMRKINRIKNEFYISVNSEKENKPRTRSNLREAKHKLQDIWNSSGCREQHTPLRSNFLVPAYYLNGCLPITKESFDNSHSRSGVHRLNESMACEAPERQKPPIHSLTKAVSPGTSALQEKTASSRSPILGNIAKCSTPYRTGSSSVRSAQSQGKEPGVGPYSPNFLKLKREAGLADTFANTSKRLNRGSNERSSEQLPFVTPRDEFAGIGSARKIATGSKRIPSEEFSSIQSRKPSQDAASTPVSYTHLRAHETPEHLVCRLLLEKKKK